jgi:hypothetical protein
VSCPDWTALTAHRHDRNHREGSEPAGWGEALTHLDGCTLCRRQALAADPTLVFRRLAAVPAAAMTPAEERSEADSVRAAVAAMRAASRLDSLRLDSLNTRPRTSSLWKRWSMGAMAAVLALAAVVVPSERVVPSSSSKVAADAAIFREGRVEVGPLDEPVAAAQQVDLEESVVEGVNLPDARVYHMSGDGLSVVMVVDESLDI